MGGIFVCTAGLVKQPDKQLQTAVQMRYLSSLSAGHAAKTTSERIIAMDVMVTMRDERTFILCHSVSYGFLRDGKAIKVGL